MSRNRRKRRPDPRFCLPGVLLLLACGDSSPEVASGPVRVTRVSPSGAVLSTRPIAVRFTGPVSGAEPATGPAAPVVRVVPPLAMVRRWTAPDRLELIPEEPFRPGVRYRFRLEDVRGPERIRVEGTSFEVHRELFRLARVYARAESAIARITVAFNLPVAPEAARERVRFRGRSGDKAARLLTAEPARRLRFEVPLQPGESGLSIHVAADLRPAAGGEPLGKPVMRDVDLEPGPLDLEDGRFGRIDDVFGLVLRLNGEVDPARARAYIDVSPGPIRSLRRHPEGLFVVGPRAGQTHHVVIRSGMPAEDPRRLVGRFELEVEAGTALPALRLGAADGFVLLGSDGFTELESRGVSRVVVRIWRIPRGAARFDTVPPRPPMHGTVVFEGEQPVAGAKHTLRVPVPTADLHAVEVFDAARPWIRDAAWVMGRGLLLSARASPGRFDVQVRQRRGLAPVSRARVNAFTRSGRALGELRSDRDGRAGWPFISAHDPVVWVQASWGDEFAHLPLEHAEHRARPLMSGLRARPPLVVDRHRYVDGETVSGAYLAPLPRGVARQVVLKDGRGRPVAEAPVSSRGGFDLVIPVGTPADFFTLEFRVEGVLWAAVRIAVQSAGPQPFLLAVDPRGAGVFAVRVLPGDFGTTPERTELSGVCVVERPHVVRNGFALSTPGPTLRRAIPRRTLIAGSEARVSCPVFDDGTTAHLELVGDAGLNVRQLGLGMTPAVSPAGRWSLRRRLTPDGVAVEGVAASAETEEVGRLAVERRGSDQKWSLLSRSRVRLSTEPRTVAAPAKETGRYRYTLFDARGVARARLEAMARTSSVGGAGEDSIGLFGPVRPVRPAGEVGPVLADAPVVLRVVSARAGRLTITAERYGVPPAVREVRVLAGDTEIPVTIPRASSSPHVQIRAELRTARPGGPALIATSAVLLVQQKAGGLDVRLVGKRIELPSGGPDALAYVAVTDRSRRTHPSHEWRPLDLPARHFDSLALHAWVSRTEDPALPTVPRIPLDVAGALERQPAVVLGPVELSSRIVRRWFDPRSLPPSPELIAWVRSGHGVARLRRALSSPGPELRLDAPRYARVGDHFEAPLELTTPGLHGGEVTARVLVAGGLALTPGASPSVSFPAGVSSRTIPVLATEPRASQIVVRLLDRRVWRTARTFVAGPMETTPMSGKTLRVRLQGGMAQNQDSAEEEKEPSPKPAQEGMKRGSILLPPSVDDSGARLVVGPNRAFGYVAAWGAVAREPPGPTRDAAWLLASRALPGIGGSDAATTEPLRLRLTAEGKTEAYPGGPTGPAQQDVLAGLAFVDRSERLPEPLMFRLRTLADDPFGSVEAATAARIIAQEEGCPSLDGWFGRRGRSSAIEAIVAAIEIHCAEVKLGVTRLNRVRAPTRRPWEDALAVLALAAERRGQARARVFVRGLTEQAREGRWGSMEVDAVALLALARFGGFSGPRSSFYGSIRRGRSVVGRFTSRSPQWFEGGRPEAPLSGGLMEVFGAGVAWASILTPIRDAHASPPSGGGLSLAVDLFEGNGRVVGERVLATEPLTLRFAVGMAPSAPRKPTPVLVHVPLPAGWTVLGIIGKRPPRAQLAFRHGAVEMGLTMSPGERVVVQVRVVPRIQGRFLMPRAVARIPWAKTDGRAQTVPRRIEVALP